jgi:serine/threonine protein kinase
MYVTEKIQNVLHIEEWVIQQVRKSYGICHIKRIQTMQANPWGITFLFFIKLLHGNYRVVLKCVPAFFKSEPYVVNILSNKFPENIPRVLGFLEDNQEKKWWLLTEWVEGRPLSVLEMQHYISTIQLWAQIQSKISVCTDINIIKKITVQKIKSMVEDLIGYLYEIGKDSCFNTKPILEKIINSQKGIYSVAESLDGFPLIFDHGDFHAGNVIIDSSDNPIIFDWSDATLSCGLLSMDFFILSFARQFGNDHITDLVNSYIDLLDISGLSKKDLIFWLKQSLLLAPLRAAHAYIDIEKGASIKGKMLNTINFWISRLNKNLYKGYNYDRKIIYA